MPSAFLCFALIAFPLPKNRPAAPPPETLIRLSVQAKAAPKPVLRIQLLPELQEQKPGNPIPAYLKCLLDQDNTTPESNLGPAALRAVDRAARLEKPDWQVLTQLQKEGFNLLLPDLQKMRELAVGLQARFREEVAQQRFDDAIVTAKTKFALARHTGEHPTIIGDLVAIAIASIAIAPLEELLEQPGCPNLYWALTNLPHPLISIEKGLDGERTLLVSEFFNLSSKQAMSAAQIKKVIDRLEELRRFESDKLKQTARQWIGVRTRDDKYLKSARARLVETGLTAEVLDTFPADQVVLLDELREFQVRRDEATKYMKLPTWEYEAFNAKETPASEPALLGAFVTSFRKVRLAQGRLEQRIALLRHVEALRIFAAENGGKLPTKLDEIKLPLPVDPYTGKPFRYAKEGETAHLRGSPPIGQQDSPAFNLHYEITIRK